MGRKAEETPFVRRVMSLGLGSLTALRDALVHGRDSSTVNRWSKGEMRIDAAVETLLRVAALVPIERRAAVWAPLPNLTRERAPIIRLLIAFDLLPKTDRGKALELAMADEYSAELQIQNVAQPPGEA